MILFIGIIAGAALFDSFHSGSSELEAQTAQRTSSHDVNSTHLFAFVTTSGSVAVQLVKAYRLQVKKHFPLTDFSQFLFLQAGEYSRLYQSSYENDIPVNQVKLSFLIHHLHQGAPDDGIPSIA